MRIFITFMIFFSFIIIIIIAWLFFRMPTIGDAAGVIARIFDRSLPLSVYIPALPTPPLILLGCVIMFVKDFRDEFFPGKALLMNSRSALVRWCTYVVLLISIMLMGVFGSDQFIYANF